MYVLLSTCWGIPNLYLDALCGPSVLLSTWIGTMVLQSPVPAFGHVHSVIYNSFLLILVVNSETTLPSTPEYAAYSPKWKRNYASSIKCNKKLWSDFVMSVLTSSVIWLSYIIQIGWLSICNYFFFVSDPSIVETLLSKHSRAYLCRW